MEPSLEMLDALDQRFFVKRRGARQVPKPERMMEDTLIRRARQRRSQIAAQVGINGWSKRLGGGKGDILLFLDLSRSASGAQACCQAKSRCRPLHPRRFSIRCLTLLLMEIGAATPGTKAPL
jgi:hypothetical protein